jgi:hypothetical protein
MLPSPPLPRERAVSSAAAWALPPQHRRAAAQPIPRLRQVASCGGDGAIVWQVSVRLSLRLAGPSLPLFAKQDDRRAVPPCSAFRR